MATLKGLLSLPQQVSVNKSKSDYEAVVLTAVNTVVRKLNINANKLVSLGALHDGAPNLSYLSASKNELNYAGIKEVYKLKKLVTLILSLNKLEKIPKSLSKLPQLQALILNGNQISKFPALEIPTLSALVLSRNTISQLSPDAFAGLPSLTKLSLSHNGLTEFPDVSRNLGLRELRLNGNQLTSVPSLEANEELVQLDVGSNKIRDGWHAVKLVGPKLKNLSLRGNCPELDIPTGDLLEHYPMLMTYNDKVIGKHNIERNKKRKEWVAKWKQEHGRPAVSEAKASQDGGHATPVTNTESVDSTEGPTEIDGNNRSRSNSAASNGGDAASQLTSMLLRPPTKVFDEDWSKIILASGRRAAETSASSGNGSSDAHREQKRLKQRKRRARARSRSGSRESLERATENSHSTEKAESPSPAPAPTKQKGKVPKSKSGKLTKKAQKPKENPKEVKPTKPKDVGSGIKSVEHVPSKKKLKPSHDDGGAIKNNKSVDKPVTENVFEQLGQTGWAASTGWD